MCDKLHKIIHDVLKNTYICINKNCHDKEPTMNYFAYGYKKNSEILWMLYVLQNDVYCYLNKSHST